MTMTSFPPFNSFLHSYLKAVENSGTAIALRGKDGVVFAVEKLVTSKLYEKGANKRLFTVDRHVGVAVAGLLADAKQVVENAAREAAHYRYLYTAYRETFFIHSITEDHICRPCLNSFFNFVFIRSNVSAGQNMELLSHCPI